MKCKCCASEFKVICTHLKSSTECQSCYNMKDLTERFDKKRNNDKKYYQENKTEILSKRKRIV